MKKAFALGLALSVLAPVAARAQALEVGILADKLEGKGATLTAIDGNYTHPGTYNSINPSGYGLRLAYNFLDLKIASLGVAATYRAKTTETLTLNGSNYGQAGDQYTAVGVQADWKFLLNLHAGIDYRFEKISSYASTPYAPPSFTYVQYPTDTTSLNRPWAVVGIGFSAPLPVVSPFIRLEVASPLTKPSTSAADADDFRKAMAPSLQVALYGGIRF